MKKLSFIILLLSLLFVVPSNAQKKPRKVKKSAKTKTAKNKKQTEKIISAGVVNGRAVYLEKPIYPVAAIYTKTYGTVKVSVLIDEQGNVLKAEVVSGNPLLIGNTISAAYNSKFEPITISGNPVKVRGVIHYNFIPEEYNWLDIGNNFQNWRLDKMLPSGFEEEKNLFESYKIADDENQISILQTIRSSIEGKISDDAKKLWLFQVGILFAEIENNCCRAENLSESIEKLQILLISPPEKVSPLLIKKLNLLVELSEQTTTKTYWQMQDIKDNIPTLGK